MCCEWMCACVCVRGCAGGEITRMLGDDRYNGTQ